MADPIRIEIDDGEVRAVLGRLVAACEDPAPAFALIGEYLVESTQQRFDGQAAPDGTPWPANSEVTIRRYLAALGRISKKLPARGAGKKPLEGESGMLRDMIHYTVLPDGVEVGSPMVYAAMQQFGGTKAQWPHLWGDIPPRPFLGLSDEDKRQVLDIVSSFLGEALGG